MAGRSDCGRQACAGVGEEIVRGRAQGSLRRRWQLCGEQEDRGKSDAREGKGIIRSHTLGAKSVEQAAFSGAGAASNGELCLVRPGEQEIGEGQWGAGYHQGRAYRRGWASFNPCAEEEDEKIEIGNDRARRGMDAWRRKEDKKGNAARRWPCQGPQQQGNVKRTW